LNLKGNDARINLPLKLKEETKMGIQVGREAPDFTANAYHGGTAKEIRLSDFRGKWVMLCFYPADFTCV
jgi:peroxiredoxin (alkyl hydroperoxide reductase subunit C)